MSDFVKDVLAQSGFAFMAVVFGVALLKVYRDRETERKEHHTEITTLLERQIVKSDKGALKDQEIAEQLRQTVDALMERFTK